MLAYLYTLVCPPVTQQHLAEARRVEELAAAYYLECQDKVDQAMSPTASVDIIEYVHLLNNRDEARRYWKNQCDNTSAKEDRLRFQKSHGIPEPPLMMPAHPTRLK